MIPLERSIMKMKSSLGLKQKLNNINSILAQGDHDKRQDHDNNYADNHVDCSVSLHLEEVKKEVSRRRHHLLQELVIRFHFFPDYRFIFSANNQ